MSKELSPLAAAIINSLLPFVNEEDKQGLNATFATLKSTAAEATTKMQEIVKGATEAVESESTTADNNVWALTSCGDYYIQFDNRIHGQTKDENGNDTPKVSDKTGQFAKRRGVNPSEFNKIEGELIDAHGLDKTEFELVDGVPVAIGGETISEPEPEQEQVQEEKPSRPVRPGAEKPSRPARPGGKAEAIEKPAEDEHRKAALASINQLTSTHGVDYDFLIGQLLEEHGVNSFQDLAPEFNQTVARDSKAWVDWLNMIVEIENWFKAKDEEHGETSHEQFVEVLGDFSVNAVNELTRDQLSAFYDDVNELKQQWVAFLGE